MSALQVNSGTANNFCGSFWQTDPFAERRTSEFFQFFAEPNHLSIEIEERFRAGAILGLYRFHGALPRGGFYGIVATNSFGVHFEAKKPGQIVNNKDRLRGISVQHLMPSTLRGTNGNDGDEYHHRNHSESDDHAAVSAVA
jgi:hypothetical protein